MRKICLLIFYTILIKGYGQTDPTCIPNPDLLSGQKVSKVAEKMPEYPGGQIKMLQDIRAQLGYSNDQEIQDKVNVTFIVDSSGNIRNECIFKPFDNKEMTPIEQTILKIVRSMPAWAPGENKGKKIPIRILLPIIIEIDR